MFRKGASIEFFPAGSVRLGSSPRSWLKPLIPSLKDSALVCGGGGLTVLTTSGAQTGLGSPVVGIPNELKHALVAGAVAGGGPTVIHKAPTPAGIGIMQDANGFSDPRISPLGLFLGALKPTLAAMLLFPVRALNSFSAAGRAVSVFP